MQEEGRRESLTEPIPRRLQRLDQVVEKVGRFRTTMALTPTTIERTPQGASCDKVGWVASSTKAARGF